MDDTEKIYMIPMILMILGNMVDLNLAPEKGTIKISKEPTKHFLRDLKAKLTLKFGDEFSYNGALLYAVTRNYLDEEKIDYFLDTLVTIIWKSDQEVRGADTISYPEGLEKLVSLLVDGFSEEEKNEILKKGKNFYKKEDQTADKKYKNDKISKEELEEIKEENEEKKERIEQVLEEIYKISQLDLTDIKVSTNLKVKKSGEEVEI